MEGAYHEVEASHEKNKVDQKEPMSLECDFSFGDEGSCDIALFTSNYCAFDVCVCFWEAESEDDDQDRRASSKPVKGAPSMACGVD